MMYSPSELPDNFLFKAVLILQYSSLHGVMRSLITSLTKGTWCIIERSWSCDFETLLFTNFVFIPLKVSSFSQLNCMVVVRVTLHETYHIYFCS